MKRVIKKYEKLDRALRSLIQEQYPYGVEDYLIKIKTGNGFFYAFTLETEEVRYMIKVKEDQQFIEPGLDDLDQKPEGLEDMDLGFA